MTTKPKAHKGFACMSPEKFKEIARKGGASVPYYKRSFFVDRDLAAVAGVKGGEATHVHRGRTPKA